MRGAKSRPDPFDYDSNPERFRTASRAVEKYSVVGDVHEPIAVRLAEEMLLPVLDIGCGEGRLTSLLQERGVPFFGLDRSPTMLRAAPKPCIRGDATHLPFRSGSFGSVAALYMMYHLANPKEAIAESYRVLRPGGLFVTATPSRHDDPELAAVLPQRLPSTFDAEIAPDMVGEFFQNIEVEIWDAPLVYLPDFDALVTYLVGRRLEPPEAKVVARQVGAPLTLTKRGVLIYGHKVL